MSDVKRLWSENRLAVVGGILSAVGFVFLLSFVTMGGVRRPDQAKMAFAILGLLSSVGLVFGARFLSGSTRLATLCGLGWFLILLPGFFGGRFSYAGFFGGRFSYADFLPGLYFLRGGDTGLMTLPLICLIAVVAGLLVYEAGYRSEGVRWSVGAAAVVALITNAVYCLMLMSSRTRWADRMVREIRGGDATTIIAFVVVTLAVWLILLLALAMVCSERPKPSLAPAALRIAFFLGWALLGLTVLAAIVRLAAAFSTARHPRLGDLLMWVIVSILAFLVPFLVGAILAVQTSAALMISMLGGAAATAAAGGSGPAETPATATGGGWSAAAPAPVTATDPAEVLRALKRLRDENLISPEEYEAKKQNLMARL